MAQVDGSGFCPTCNQQRLIRRKGTNHVLHLILTLVTFGLWGIVWIITALSNRGNSEWRCSVCGTRVTHFVASQAEWGGQMWPPATPIQKQGP